MDLIQHRWHIYQRCWLPMTAIWVQNMRPETTGYSCAHNTNPNIYTVSKRNGIKKYFLLLIQSTFTETPSEMISTNAVYMKIKEISSRTANPRPQITIQLLAHELMSTGDHIVPYLNELKKMRLIQFDSYRPTFLRLTLLGYTAE